MESWHSYPKIFALGHSALNGLFEDPVTVEEKIDGSQFSFGRLNGELRCKSRNCELVPTDAGMFQAGVDAVSKLDLRDGWTYRGEYLRVPKHNTLQYGRVPEHHVILFDIGVGKEEYVSWSTKSFEAKRLGLEVAPLLTSGRIAGFSELSALLEGESVLGGGIEGVVVKNYRRFTVDGHVMMGKLVSERFKERHSVEWKGANPGSGDIIQRIVEAYRTEARWEKSVGFLRDAGALANEPKDIGLLIPRIKQDVAEECEAELKEALWRWARDKILRGVTHGAAEWYKQRVAGSCFPEDE